MTQPKALFTGMGSWHLGNTAREFEKLDALAGYWVSKSSRSGVSEQYYRRVWDYHLAQKLFYHLPFINIEEEMRWVNLPFYERWLARQTLPPETNVVQSCMGSCEALFRFAERSGRKILKVYDAPNSHPTTYIGYWQRECDLYCPGYRVPMCAAAQSRVNREIEAADVVLCPSNFVRDTMLQNGVPAGKCVVSHFGVDTSVFKPRTEPPTVPTFVCVASICLRKGHQYLFRAFQQVRKELPNARLICVGSIRPDFKRELPKWEGTFEYHRSLPHSEIARLLQSSTAFVLPSVEEGFARVLSESMACALPVIATYETGATTVIRDGHEGIIIPARSVQLLAEAMIALGSDPERNLQMGKEAYRAGGQSNTWADYAKRLHDIYADRLERLN
jgi:glycosyltransferase involved in cell wall biosynthesis